VSASNGAVRVAAFPFMERNPYGRLLYGALAGVGIQAVADPRLDVGWLWRHRKQVSFLHFHWDKYYYESLVRRPRFRHLWSWIKLVRYALLLVIARALGYRIVWTVHEVVPHEPRSRRRDLVAAALLARASHALLAHDHATAVRAGRLLRIDADRVAVVPHGSYVGTYPAGRPREAVRAEWGLEASTFVFLAFGHIRSYKRLDLVLDAFSRVEEDDVALVIAGSLNWRFRELEWEKRMLAHLSSAAADDPRIRYRIGRVPDEGVAELHAACDAAVLGRSDGWTSGSMILAISQGLPVVAARRPAYVALLGNGDRAAGWLHEPGSASSLAVTLTQAARERERVSDKAYEARRRAAALDWREAAASTASVMLSTLPRQRP
jgi:beta-1,4-mannosyltransferase